ILIGKGGGRNKITSPERDAVEAVLKGRFVDQPLDHVNHFWPAGTTVRDGRDRVREHGARSHMRQWNAITGGYQPDAFNERNVGPRVRADITEIRSTQGEKMAVRIEREFGGDCEIAAHIVAEEGLVPFGSPLNRPPHALGAPGHQRELGKEAVACAKVAADFSGNDADGFLRHAENVREFALLTHDAARTGIESV